VWITLARFVHAHARGARFARSSSTLAFEEYDAIPCSEPSNGPSNCSLRIVENSDPEGSATNFSIDSLSGEASSGLPLKPVVSARHGHIVGPRIHQNSPPGAEDDPVPVVTIVSEEVEGECDVGRDVEGSENTADRRALSGSDLPEWRDLAGSFLPQQRGDRRGRAGEPGIVGSEVHRQG